MPASSSCAASAAIISEPSQSCSELPIKSCCFWLIIFSGSHERQAARIIIMIRLVFIGGRANIARPTAAATTFAYNSCCSPRRRRFTLLAQRGPTKRRRRIFGSTQHDDVCLHDGACPLTSRSGRQRGRSHERRGSELATFWENTTGKKI